MSKSHKKLLENPISRLEAIPAELDEHEDRWKIESQIQRAK